MHIYNKKANWLLLSVQIKLRLIHLLGHKGKHCTGCHIDSLTLKTDKQSVYVPDKAKKR